MGAIVVSGAVDADVLTSTLLGIAGAAGVSVLKSIAGIKTDRAAPVWLRYIDRMGAASAGTILGFLTADQALTTSVPLGNVLAAAVASALIAAITYYLAPPAVEASGSVALAFKGGAAR